MNTPLIISTLSAAIILMPGISLANSDESQYPAANFQPKVLFQSEEASNASSAIKSMGEKSVYDPKYPATHFEPKVLYQDDSAIKATSHLTFQGKKSVYDPNYPAANFEPKVIYP